MKSAGKEFGPPSGAATRLPIDRVVDELRTLRVRSLEHRGRQDRPPKLPSRKFLAGIVEGLSAALFPNRLGLPGLTDEGIDYFVGHTLDMSLRALTEQLALELQFTSGFERLSDADRERVLYITHEFACHLPLIRSQLESDLIAAFEGDPAARTIDEVLVCYPGIAAITHYRIAHELHQLGATLVARIISELAHSATGIDIHPGAVIGEQFFIDHGTGVVIGETAVLGKHVRLYQAVTLGAKRFHSDGAGALIKGEPRHPIVEDDVVIYAGATILGRVTIGRGSVVGGNVWLTRSVPPFSRVSQAHVLDELIIDGSGI